MAICVLRSRLSIIISLISVSVCCSCLLFPTVYAASANQYNDGNYRAPRKNTFMAMSLISVCPIGLRMI